MYMSLCCLRILDKQIQIIGAGMPPTLYYNCVKNSIEEIEASGPPLGGFPNFGYEINKYELSKGDVIILMSDGFSERMNNKKEIFGWNKGKELLSQMNYLSSDQIVREFVKVNDEWGGTREQDDDITIVVLKVK
jgi:sigma-B regulation protein RsbU (phosphoserine phosphatase)